MTQQKSRKRRVRARMAKTGERYTAARHHLVAQNAIPAGGPGGEPTSTPPPATRHESEPEPTAAAVPDSPFRGEHGASDDALVQRTGHGWEHWYRLLDAWGGASRSHADIARWLNAEQGVDGWWAQELTVRYEMAIGRRLPGQRPDGFEATVSRTLGAPAERVYEAFVDDARRAAWMGRALRLRTATPHRTARFDWDDGAERVVVGFTAKGDRTVVALAHQRMPDADAAAASRAFWRERLAALEHQLTEG